MGFIACKGRDALCRVIDQVGDYKILKASQGYIVKNVKGSYKNHGHFKQLKTCYLIIDLIRKRQVPRSRYLRGATLRISTDKNYIEKVKRKIEKDRNKQKYIAVDTTGKYKVRIIMSTYLCRCFSYIEK